MRLSMVWRDSAMSGWQEEQVAARSRLKSTAEKTFALMEASRDTAHENTQQLKTIYKDVHVSVLGERHLYY